MHDQGGETAAICFSILALVERHRIEPLAYVSALLTALSSTEVDWTGSPPDVWIAAHPEHLLMYRREEAEAAAMARRRSSGCFAEESPGTQPKPLSWLGVHGPDRGTGALQRDHVGIHRARPGGKT